MQIPESPPADISDRPGTSFTDQSSLRNPSVSQDRPGLESAAVIPEVHSEATTNGTIPDGQAGLANNHVNQVSHRPIILQYHNTVFIDDSLVQPQVDSEGFTERPATIDEITRAQNEAAG